MNEPPGALKPFYKIPVQFLHCKTQFPETDTLNDDWRKELDE
jgi:hypothetical protein